MSSLLPINSTQLERAIEAATDEVTDIPLRTLYNPDTCPTDLLHQLAWAWSVDRWDNNWSEAIKRAAIRSAFYVHAHKGTIGALRRVVEPLGYLIEVQEWWQTTPKGVPGTFALKVGVLETGITEEMYQELTWLIDDAKPVSRHMTGLAISLESTGPINIFAGTYDGDVIDVYPPLLRDIESTGFIGGGGREHSIDELEVYPPSPTTILIECYLGVPGREHSIDLLDVYP
ncbi:UNVERIFIED_ORG: phage tail P2-like protein [Pseudomonas fluorescens]